MISRPDNPVVVITGASSGIGRAIALRLARRGATVIAIARREAILRELAQLAAPSERHEGRIEPVSLDVSDERALRALARSTVERLGRRGGPPSAPRVAAVAGRRPRRHELRDTRSIRRCHPPVPAARRQLRGAPIVSRPPAFIANFDSATAMVRATASYLHGRDFPALGLSPILEVPAARANLLPRKLRRALYIFSGWNESIPVRKVPTVDAEAMSRWVTAEHPSRPYPAVAIGSSNGAAVHLYAAFGIPWLPQTFLVPVRQSVHPDDPTRAMELGRQPGRALPDRDPDLALHHMHDANQDRLMVRAMTYFRVERRRLGRAYERFLEEHLPPGGTIPVIECGQEWGVARIDERHVFQHGAVGGATEQEFHHGSERVEEYLARYDSPVRRWDGPEPHLRAPEAELGFDDALLDDIRRIASERHYRVTRVRFDEPQALSPLVADLHRWWYGRRNIPGRRLLAESFLVLEPWWVLRTGSVPCWMELNMRLSLDALNAYLDSVEQFDEINLMLFQHGVEAVGLPTIAEWDRARERGRGPGRLVGLDPEEFPLDHAHFARYHTAVQQVAARHPMPGPLPLSGLDTFLEHHGDAFDVTFETEAATPQLTRATGAGPSPGGAPDR